MKDNNYLGFFGLNPYMFAPNNNGKLQSTNFVKKLKDLNRIEHMVTAFCSCPSSNKVSDEISIMYGKWDKNSAGILDDVSLIKTNGIKEWRMTLKQVSLNGFSYIRDDRYV